MPWLKSGDNAATHPVVLRAFSLGVDPNWLFGFVMRCALQAAAHTTDYLIEEGTAYFIGAQNADEAIDAAVRAGYWTPEPDHPVRAWRMIDDPEFIHMRLKAEIDWEKQQRADTANTRLTSAVRLRDGDGCRYCGVVVSWAARKGNRRGTYDHRVPGQQAETEADLVVACGGCNSGRQNDPEADRRYPLRPVPLHPHYSDGSVKFLQSHGIAIPKTDLRPGNQPDPAPATPLPAGPRITSDPATSGATPSVEESADSSEKDAHSAGRDGTGRDGQVPVGTGDGWRRQRGKRGARGRPR